jgi:hypothetical protein
VVTLCSLLVVLVALLALSSPYTPFAAGLDLQPGRVLSPLYTYLFRNALMNSVLLLVGVYLLCLLIGWTWAVTGITPMLRPLLLLPLLMPGALSGLLWRPFFAGWLDLAQAELSLLFTALVMLWRIVPLAAWHFSLDRDNWPRFIPLCALLVLLDGDLVLTLTRGEPFNAGHTWSSWIVQQLWVSRAWGYAAAMAGALTLVVALMTLWASRPTSPSKPPSTPPSTGIPHGSPLGDYAIFFWIAGPLLWPLWLFIQAPWQAIDTLVANGWLLWLVNGALLWGGVTWLVMRLSWPLREGRARQITRIVTLAMLPITLVAIAYLAHQLPLLRSRFVLLSLLSLFAAGLWMGGDRPAAGRAQWRKAAGYAALVLANTLPLQLVTRLPAFAWTPSLGTLWTLAEAPHATAALGASLLLYGLWAGLAAWLLADN